MPRTKLSLTIGYDVENKQNQQTIFQPPKKEDIDKALAELKTETAFFLILEDEKTQESLGIFINYPTPDSQDIYQVKGQFLVSNTLENYELQTNYKTASTALLNFYNSNPINFQSWQKKTLPIKSLIKSLLLISLVILTISFATILFSNNSIAVGAAALTAKSILTAIYTIYMFHIGIKFMEGPLKHFLEKIFNHSITEEKTRIWTIIKKPKSNWLKNLILNTILMSTHFIIEITIAAIALLPIYLFW